MSRGISLSTIVSALLEGDRPDLAEAVLELARLATTIGLDTPVFPDTSTRASELVDASTGRQGGAVAVDEVNRAAAAQAASTVKAKPRKRNGRAA